MASAQIMLVDDEPSNLESLERILRSDGFQVISFQNPQHALQHLRSNPVDIVITDLRMNSLSGIELLEASKLLDPSVEVILITAYGTVEIAVAAIKKGAYDFITKPLQRITVLKTIHKALEKKCLLSENLSLREELRSQYNSSHKLIGRSEAHRQAILIADQAARSRANVLIEGESGTGKGLLAEYLHRNSDFAQGIFVKINCTAIPDNLLEAELFGYEPGAFTGAIRRKKGRVELAHNGTLFFDEIGIAPLAFQAKLLRFLQEGEFERLGSNETFRVSARVIAATNSDLKHSIHSGQFREDLYYRLNVIHIKVPPLRERMDDIPILTQKFIDESAKKNGRPVPLLHPKTLDCMKNHKWPGNIRELENLMERLVVLNKTGVIVPEDLPPDFGVVRKNRNIVIPIGIPLRQLEALVMEETLKVTEGDRKLAAKLLGIHPRTVHRHLETAVNPISPAISPDLNSLIGDKDNHI